MRLFFGQLRLIISSTSESFHTARVTLTLTLVQRRPFVRISEHILTETRSPPRYHLANSHSCVFTRTPNTSISSIATEAPASRQRRGDGGGGVHEHNTIARSHTIGRSALLHTERDTLSSASTRRAGFKRSTPTKTATTAANTHTANSTSPVAASFSVRGVYHSTTSRYD